MNIDHVNSRLSIYDIPQFFRNYMEYRSKEFNPTDTIVWPTLRNMLPDLDEACVLDIGFGYGDFCKYAINKGANSITAIDNSRLMYNYAIKNNSDSRINYKLVSAEDFEELQEQYHLVTSSMTFHYLSNLPSMFNKIHGWLKPGGHLVFSMNHPSYTSGLDEQTIARCLTRGILLLIRYFEEGPREHIWLVHKIVKYHVMMDTIINGLLNAGFVLEGFAEPTISNELATAEPEIAYAKQAPFCVVIKARKPERRDHVGHAI